MSSGPLLICLKWVSTRPEIDPLTGTVTTDPRFSGAGPSDRSALEWALRLSDGGSDVVVVTVAPAAAEPMLREALAAGAAAAIRIDAEPDMPSAAVAGQLAVVATSLSATMVITGDHSLDRGSGSVPAFVAAELDWPQALGLIWAATDGDLVGAERRLDQGRRERLAIVGSAVISFEAGPQLRRASLTATLEATKALIEVRPAAAVRARSRSPAVVDVGPYRPRTNVKPGPVGTTRERILELSGSMSGEVTARIFDGPPGEAAAVAHAQLVEWGYVEGP